MEKHFLRNLIIFKLLIVISFITITHAYAYIQYFGVAQYVGRQIIMKASQNGAFTALGTSALGEAAVLQEMAGLSSAAVAAETTAVTTGTISVTGILGNIANILNIGFLMKSVDDKTQIQINSNKSATVQTQISQPARPVDIPPGALMIGQPMWTSSTSTISVSNPGFADPYSTLLKIVDGMPPSYKPITLQNCHLTATQYYCEMHTSVWGYDSNVGGAYANKNNTLSNVNCGLGAMTTDNVTCGSAPPELATSSQTQLVPYSSSNDVASGIPSSELSKTMSPQTMADVSNKIWEKLSAKPGTAIPRYDPAKPITATDITNAGAGDSTLSIPKVSDVVNQTPTSSQISNPQSGNPGTSSNTGSSSNTITQNPTTDPANPPPPNVGPPNLEATPTIDKILGPIMGLMPTLKNFSMPSYTTQCPTLNIQFDFMSHHFGGGTGDLHCQVIGQHRNEIRAVAIGIATILIIFIFIGAA